MITSKIGNRIRELRKKEGINQEKLAFKADLDRTYIAGVESGKRNVSVKTLKKILDALGITLIIFIIVFPLFNILKKTPSTSIPKIGIKNMKSNRAKLDFINSGI